MEKWQGYYHEVLSPANIKPVFQTFSLVKYFKLDRVLAYFTLGIGDEPEFLIQDVFTILIQTKTYFSNNKIL